MMQRFAFISTIVCLLMSAHAAKAADEIDFSSEIRPLLSNQCFHCHGPDDESREADLRLDLQSGLFEDRGGYAAVVPHDIEASELARRILSDDPDEQMPPPDANKSLSPAQRQLLVRWIREGAPWEQHWAFVPPQKPSVPSVPDEYTAWVRNEIDAFTLSRMLEQRLTPSPPAAPFTLTRRLFLDLIGLPPTPEEADQWVARIWGQDYLNAARTASAAESEAPAVPPADEAEYRRLVADLLERQEYGERWARRWLDLARYADTNGYEKDRPRSIWPYRDWVIRAINSDTPFDRFSIEQLAGDMLPDATQDQLVATGFHRNTMLNEEGGIDPLEFRFHAMTDRAATTGTTWLGLTVGCAQCHTHKYDPLSHREYYGLMAFLNNCDEPTLELRPDDFHERWQANLRKADQLVRDLAKQWPIDQLMAAVSTCTNAVGRAKEEFQIASDGTITVSGVSAKATYELEYDVASAEIDTLQLKTSAAGKKRGPGHTRHGNFVLSELTVSLLSDDDGKTLVIPVTVRARSATAEQQGFPIAQAVDGDAMTGWAIDNGSGVPRDATATFDLSLPEAAASSSGPIRLRVELDQQYGARHTIEQFQVVFGSTLSDSALAERRREAVDAAFAEWLAEQRSTAVDWVPLQPVKTDANLALLSIEDDATIFATGDTAKQDFYEVTFAPFSEAVTSLRLETLPDERLPARGPGTTYYEGTIGDFYLTEFQVRHDDETVNVKSATESYAANRFGNNPVSAALTIDGDIQTGWSVHDGQGRRHTAVYNLSQPVPAGVPITIRMTFGRHYASALGKFRVSATGASLTPVARRMSRRGEELLLVADQDLQQGEREELLREFLLSEPRLAGAAAKIRTLRSPPSVPTTLVMQERPAENPRATHRHHRGEYLQPEEPVQRHTPAFLHEWPKDLPRNRLGFARWLFHPDNPLTARVVVNRHWDTLFGTGIVSTVDDFGLQGMPPSHPALLDWLAVTFRTNDNWSLKALHRRIVNSATYRQSAEVPDEAGARDPQNRLLSYAPRFRLDAEIIRDSALQATGLLSDKRFGPPVRPPQPPGITEVAFGKPKWNVSSSEDRYRRSIYTEIKRTAPFAMITTFDGLSGETCTAKRNRSNSPLQALTLLNDVMFIDMIRHQGRHLSQTAHDSHQELRERALVQQQFRNTLTRFPTRAETDRLVDFLRATRQSYLDDPESAAALMDSDSEKDKEVHDARPADAVADAAAWAALTRVLLGLDEFVTRP